MTDTLLEILLILLLILVNGFFAMSEIGLVSARKVRMQQRAEEGDRAARAALELAESPNRMLSTVQIGITLVGVLAGAIGSATLGDKLAAELARTAWLAPYANAAAVFIVVLLTTYFSLVLGELIPKRIGMNNPEKVAAAVALPMRFLSRITAPVVRLLSLSTDLGLRLIGAAPSNEPPVTEEEIKVLLEQGTQVGVFEAYEQDMVEGVFRLADRYVESIMTPRTEIEWINLDDSIDEILEKVQNSRHTRFPVAHGSLDNVIGMLQARDLMARRLAGQPIDLNELISPALFLPDSMFALTALERFKASGAHAALVIDEYGGLLGMITLFDVLEAIVGELSDAESPEEESEIVRREDGSFLLDGLLQVHELKELLNVDELPDEERIGYQTVGGFMMSMIGTIPSAGSHFEWNGWHFEVMDMDGRRVDKVLLSPIRPEDASI